MNPFGAVRRRSRLVGEATAFSGVVALLLLVPAAFAGATSSSPTTSGVHPILRLDYSHGGQYYTSPAGQLSYCGNGKISPNTGWVCESVQVHGTSGYARGWAQVQGKLALTNLSGKHSFYELGAWNLSAGFIRVAGHCPSGAVGPSTYANGYLFWHIWVFDATLGAYVTVGNSGYLWDSGLNSCSQTGWNRAASPSMVGTFNTSKFYSTGLTYYTFNATHTYTFTLFFGCTLEISVGGGSSTPSTFGAFCNWPTPVGPSSTFTVTGLAIV